MATYFYCDIFIILMIFNCVSILTAEQSSCSYINKVVECAALGLEDVPRDLSNWFKVLYLNSNNIKAITSESFRNLDLLEEIDLSDNKISRIDADAFTSLPNLRILRLSENELEDFPALASNLPLTHLILDHNKIRAINMASLAQLPELVHFYVRYNQLTDLVQPFPSLPHLTELFLNNNRITALGNNTFNNVTKLETLRLTKNQIARLDKHTFAPLTNLKQLEMNKNRLTYIDGLTFGELGKLESLKLRRNNITQLKDGCFYGLNRIEELELDSNNLSVVNKSWLYGLDSLKTLSLSFNTIREVQAKAWGYCPDLQYLDLSNNKLTHMDVESFGSMHELVTLLLNHNQIAHIGVNTFEEMLSLETLDLDHNQISWSIEDRDGVFEGLSSLESLRLENNSIQSINEFAFLGLERLKYLYLEQNNISTVHEKTLNVMPLLESWYMESSALLCDCNLKWLPDWISSNQMSDQVRGVCAYPELLQGSAILQLSEKLLTCDRETQGTYTPMMITEPKDLIALKGQKFRLDCSAASRIASPLAIHWRKDNFPIIAHEINTTASMIDGVVMMGSELVIQNATYEDAGVYQCMAVNEVGKTYSNMARVNVHVFPMFTKRPLNVTVKSGSVAKLECAASGQPDPEISWQKDGGEDFPAARERRMHVMTNDVFMISGTKLEDQGVYTCTATNAAGTLTTDATLTVLEAPQFAEPMSDMHIGAGETAVLKCMAQGSPQPTITWLKDGEPLAMTERHFFTATDQLLVIVEAKASDSGEYMCEMRNPLGALSASMVLDVLVPSHVERVGGFFDDNATMTGMIIIAVVCIVVGTSLIWVVIIYHTRRKHELIRNGGAGGARVVGGSAAEYSATPTEETMVAGSAGSMCKAPLPTHELAYATMLNEDGTAYAPKYMNGHANGRPVRHIVLEDGVCVTYDNGLHITHNPLTGQAPNGNSMVPGMGEYQRQANHYVAPVHHGGSTSSVNQGGHGSSTEETSSGSSHSSPGTSQSNSQNTQSTGLSTFNPYPHVVISPTSPHNSSSQPLLSDEQYYSGALNNNNNRLDDNSGGYTLPHYKHSHFVPTEDGLMLPQSGMKHSKSEHQYTQKQLQSNHQPSDGCKQSAAAQDMSHSHSMGDATKPQQYLYFRGARMPISQLDTQAPVHKASSCSHLQSQGPQRQSLTALQEDGSTTTGSSQNNASNSNKRRSNQPSSHKLEGAVPPQRNCIQDTVTEISALLPVSPANHCDNSTVTSQSDNSNAMKSAQNALNSVNNNQKSLKGKVKCNDYVNVSIAEQTGLVGGQQRNGNVIMT